MAGTIMLMCKVDGVSTNMSDAAYNGTLYWSHGMRQKKIAPRRSSERNFAI